MWSFLRTFSAALLIAPWTLGWASSPALVPGDALPPLQLTDQHQRPLLVDDSTRLLIFAADKAASDLVLDVLKAEDPGTLTRIHAVYVADISAMPAPIAKMFALPRLRELSFAVGIVRDADQTAALPRQPEQVTVLVLETGQVRQVLQVGDRNSLERALGLSR